jgi:hypothetical protein
VALAPAAPGVACCTGTLEFVDSTARTSGTTSHCYVTFYHNRHMDTPQNLKLSLKEFESDDMDLSTKPGICYQWEVLQ